jgi:hypothetical protein
VRRGAWLVALAVLVACEPRRSLAQRELTLRLTPDGDSLRLVLLAAPGVEVNARLAPALELDGGDVVRFHASRLTPDSAYFAEPPVAWLPAPASARRRLITGTLRASVCSVGERICRPVVLQVSARL